MVEALTRVAPHLKPWTSVDAKHGLVPELDLFNADTDDNPVLTTHQVEDFLKGYVDEERLIRRQGIITQVRSQVFKDLSHAVHDAPMGWLPKSVWKADEWTLYRAFDWGYSSPSCVIWAAVSPNDEHMVIFGEVYGKGMSVPQLCEAIRVQEARWGISPDRIALTFCEAAEKIHGSQGPGTSVWHMFVKEGITPTIVPSGKQNKRHGIVEIRNWLTVSPHRPSPFPYREDEPQRVGSPRLFVTTDCVNWWRTMLALRHDTAPKDRNPKEDYGTDKQEDHAADATCNLFLGGPRALREAVEIDVDPAFDDAWAVGSY